MLDDLGNLPFHVKKLLHNRGGQRQYLVKLRGCLKSYNSWELEVFFWHDCPYGIDVFEPLGHGQLAISDNPRQKWWN